MNVRPLSILALTLTAALAACRTTPAPTAAPTVTGVLPTLVSAQGGTEITLTGSGFGPGVQVRFGDLAGSGVTVVNEGTLKVTAPAGTPGWVDVKVTNSVGTSAPTAQSRLNYYQMSFVEPGPGVSGLFMENLLSRGPDDRMWLGSYSNLLYAMTPDLDVARYEASFLTFRGLTRTPEGGLWFTAYQDKGGDTPKSVIGQIATDGAYISLPLPEEAWKVGAVTTGPDGNLWFVVSYNNVTQPDAIGKSTPQGAVTLYPLPANVGPWDITAGPDGNVWFTESYSKKIGKITPAGQITRYDVPGAQASDALFGITLGRDGNVWAGLTGNLIRVRPDGSMTRFPTGQPDRDIRELVMDSRGDLWFTSVNTLGRMDPAGRVQHLPVPLTAPNITSVALDAQENVWFSTFVPGSVGVLRH